jgi:hypothetical protein
VRAFISSNKSEITNEAYDEVNVRSVISEVASFEGYDVPTLSEFILKRMTSWLKLRDPEHLIKDVRS